MSRQNEKGQRSTSVFSPNLCLFSMMHLFPGTGLLTVYAFLVYCSRWSNFRPVPEKAELNHKVLCGIGALYLVPIIDRKEEHVWSFSTSQVWVWRQNTAPSTLLPIWVGMGLESKPTVTCAPQITGSRVLSYKFISQFLHGSDVKILKI